LIPPSATADSLAWYAVYTYPRHEKTVTEQLEWKSVEAFLPTFAYESRWKDRKVTIAAPLFPGYVFTRIRSSERARVLGTPSIVRILSFNGIPAPISDDEIDAIRLCVDRGATLEKHSFLKVGERVRVVAGSFEGLEGIVIRQKNGCKLVISIDLIHRSVALEVNAELLEPLPAPDANQSAGTVHLRAKHLQ
jgi:transcription antitermination factor NusG